MSSATELKKAIMEQMKDSDDLRDVLSFVDDQVDQFRKYFNAVYRHVVGGEAVRLLNMSGYMDKETMCSRIMDLDESRKRAHDAAISACSTLNRMCDRFGVEKFCPEVERDATGKETNRGEIADFVGKYVYNVYQRGIHKQPIQEIQKENDIQYGDRTSLDTAFIVAKEDGLNPDEALKIDDALIDPADGFDDLDLNDGNR